MADFDLDMDSILNSLNTDTIQQDINSINDKLADDDKISHTQQHANRITKSDNGVEYPDTFQGLINAYETAGRDNLQVEFDLVKNGFVKKKAALKQVPKDDNSLRHQLTQSLQRLYNRWLKLVQDKQGIETEVNFLKGRASGLIVKDNYLFYDEHPEAVLEKLKTGNYGCDGKIYGPTNLEVNTYEDIFENEK